jgi:hypothetical protein
VTWERDRDPLDAGDEVVATYRVHGRGRASGAEVDQRITLLWSVRDDKITRVRAYRERSEALEAAGLRDEERSGGGRAVARGCRSSGLDSGL